MNKVVLAVLLAGFGSQLIKLVVYWFQHKSLSLRDLIVTGGMPSSHAAFVISLVTIIFLEEGVSTSFAIALVIAFIVVRDAFGVRRSVGEEGLLLTEMAKKLKMKKKPHFALGHTPLQVFVGSMLGLVVGIVVHYITF